MRAKVAFIGERETLKAAVLFTILSVIVTHLDAVHAVEESSLDASFGKEETTIFATPAAGERGFPSSTRYGKLRSMGTYSTQVSSHGQEGADVKVKLSDGIRLLVLFSVRFPFLPLTMRLVTNHVTILLSSTTNEI